MPVLADSPRLPVVCLHGFTGTPYEMQPLARVLESAGHPLSAPLLPGHGKSVSDLARSTWRDWAAAAGNAVSALAAESGSPVAIVGASMGSLLAIHLARRRPAEISALVLLAPPLRFKPIEARGLAVLERLARFAGVADRVLVPKAFGADVRDPRARAQVPTLHMYPLQALLTLAELMTAAAADLEHLQTPVLLVHGRHDRTVPRAAVDEIAARLGPSVCERICLERSGHLVALDYDQAALADAVLAFLSSKARAR
jgi:carboxylesterase